MDVQTIGKIVELAAPNEIDVGNLKYVDKSMHLISPPAAATLCISTLQGLVDLLDGEFEGAKEGDALFVVIELPTRVSLMGSQSDQYGRRNVVATAEYPKVCVTFPFGSWMSPENFIIAAQQGFQRVKVQNDDGTFAKDLDYVLGIASKITADSTVDHDDDGITQRIAVKQGVTLKTDVALKARVNLAPWRTFAEIDQTLSTFILRSRVYDGNPQLALFEGDGGRWRIDAIAAIKAWFGQQITKSPIIS